MKKLSLCIDIDGTITEAYDWIPRANDYFNTKVTPKDVKVYDIHKVLGIKSEIYDEFYNLYGEVIHEEAKIRRGVKEVLTKLYEKHEIHFVTARQKKMKDVTEKWLSQHGVPLDTLSLLGKHDKVAKAQELACDVFIEDRYENAVQLAEYGFKVLLIDCYYNKGPLSSGITRVMNWLEIKDFIEGYAQQTYHYAKIAT
ncbi:5' nucleotidase, NT5C type [Clostridium aceticum]|uniref:5' nucleotidase, NT5C type n=1 Tax=Clostridium aceticum TaxID=84022 RepID=UPI0005CF3E16|nr:nucleotidase [Clostridium aceticum]KJF27686.1 nucleotidase [Clostridium aceticum]